jgi:hypothetical protein
MAIGAAFPQYFGGYYQPGEKRDDADVKWGNMRIFGVNVPSFLVHNPLLETMQIGATFRRVMDSKFHKSDIHSQGIIAGLTASVLGVGEEIPFVREIGELAKLLDPNERSQFLGNFAKSRLIPRILQESAEWTDRTKGPFSGDMIKRRPDGLVQNIASGIPYLREKMVPTAYKTLDKRGITGDEWVASDNFKRSQVGTVATQLAQERAAGNDTASIENALLTKAQEKAQDGKLSQSDADKVNTILGLTGDKAIKADDSSLSKKQLDEPEETYDSESGFIHHLSVIADALGTDPMDAFKKWYKGETIRKVSGDSIVVERMDLAASEKVKRDRKAGREMRLDHTTPLEIGGDNSLENLKVVPEEVWASYTPVENALGDAVRSGRVSGAEARRMIVDFKSGWIGTPQLAKRLGVSENELRATAGTSSSGSGKRQNNGLRLPSMKLK